METLKAFEQILSDIESITCLYYSNLTDKKSKIELAKVMIEDIESRIKLTDDSEKFEIGHVTSLMKQRFKNLKNKFQNLIDDYDGRNFKYGLREILGQIALNKFDIRMQIIAMETDDIFKNIEKRRT